MSDLPFFKSKTSQLSKVLPCSAIRARGKLHLLNTPSTLLRRLKDQFLSLFSTTSCQAKGGESCLKIPKYINNLTFFQQNIFPPLYKSPRGSQATYGMHENCSPPICQSILVMPCINPNSVINSLPCTRAANWPAVSYSP